MCTYVAYSFVLLRTVMYFFGIYFYASAMVDDIAESLAGLDKSLGKRSAGQMALDDHNGHTLAGGYGSTIK